MSTVLGVSGSGLRGDIYVCYIGWLFCRLGVGQVLLGFISKNPNIIDYSGGSSGGFD